MWGREQKRFQPHIDMLKSYVGHVDSMLEIGSNQGYFGYLCSKHGLADSMFLTDYDYGAVNKMYQHFKQMSINAKVTPGIVDITNIGENEAKLLASELVVANALIHHLILRQHMGIKMLFQMLSSMSLKFLLIEFMPLGLWTPTASEKVPDWYTLDWFLDAMKEYFEILTYVQIEENRILCLGKRR